MSGVKVLFVIDTLGSGGKERRLSELLKALAARNDIAFELVVMSNDIHYKKILDIGITIHQIIRKTRRDLSVFGKLYRLLKLINPDVVHCWDSMTAVYLAPVCKLAGCPLINGMVTNVPQKPRILNYHWIRARLTFPLSRKIVSNSHAGLRAYMVSEKKGKVIPNGFNFCRLDGMTDPGVLRRELGITTDFIVGMVASFGKQKDYATFYKAAQLLLESRQDITFLAIGAETDSERSTRLIDMNSRRYFRFLGKRSNIESYINLMDVCILATFTEGISNSILEYMAMGKPVVATAGGGTEELMTTGMTGFLVTHADYEDMCRRINELLNSSELRREMGNHGRERVKEFFPMDRMVMDYITLYKEICTVNE